jgi:PKD repeat protein
MTMRNVFRSTVTRRALVGAALVGTFAGCGLDKVSTPPMDGPSTFGTSIVLHITPDVLLADAVSTAVVQAEVRGPDGGPAPGRTIFFAVTDEGGNYVDLGTLYSTQATFHPPAPQTTEVTANNGVATVVYRVPERISVTAIQPVFIFARLVGDDAQGQQYKSARIELRPAEVRRFPAAPGNAPPSACPFFIDPEVGPQVGGTYPQNFVVRFRTGSSDSDGQVIRYFWDFGDGGQADSPDASHAWRRAGNWTVTHIVTDNNGAQAACSVVIPVS